MDRRRAKIRSTLADVLPAALMIGLLLLAWQLHSTASGSADDVLPPPDRVFSAGWADRTSLLSNLWPTLVEVLLGFSLSLASSLLLSVLLDRSRIARRSLVPVLIGSQTLPIIVLAPLVVIWFGFGLLPKVLLIALVTFFPLVVSLVEGYASAPREAMVLMRTMGAGWSTGFRIVRFPSALPRFFTGLRISVTYAVVAAVFAEYAGAEKGLGIYMQAAKNSYRTDLVLAAVIASALLTLVLYGATFALERLVVPWEAAERRSRR